jgi:hypothetical protein
MSECGDQAKRRELEEAQDDIQRIASAYANLERLTASAHDTDFTPTLGGVDMIPTPTPQP